MGKLYKHHGRKNECWSFRIAGPNGGRTRINTNTTDKRLAEEIRAKYIADQARLSAGIISDAELKAKTFVKATITEQCDAWVSQLRAQGKSDSYLSDCERAVMRVAAANGWELIRDLSEADLAKWLDAERSRKMSNRYLQKYGRALKMFSKWLCLNDRLASDPFRRIKLASPETKRVMRRRMLLPDEWIWMLEALRSPDAPTRHGMKPVERELLYDLAIQTGLRSTELRSVTAACLHVGSKVSYVELSGEYTKNGKRARQYIRNPLAQALRNLRRIGSARLLPVPRREICATMLRADLKAARSAWSKAHPKENDSRFLLVENDQGEVLDFHSLRHTCGGWLAIAGVNPKVIQTVMRHSTIKLTLDTYGHLLPDSEQDAIQLQARVIEGTKRGPLAGHFVSFGGTTSHSDGSAGSGMKSLENQEKHSKSK